MKNNVQSIDDANHYGNRKDSFEKNRIRNNRKFKRYENGENNCTKEWRPRKRIDKYVNVYTPKYTVSCWLLKSRRTCFATNSLIKAMMYMFRAIISRRFNNVNFYANIERGNFQ